MRNLNGVILAFLFLSFCVVSAQDFYVGAGIGNTFYGTEWNLQDEVKKLDKNATGYKFFAGFSTPLIFSVEGGYRHFGTVEAKEFNVTFE